MSRGRGQPIRLRRVSRDHNARSIPDKDKLDRVWREFRRTGANDLRNRLLEHYLYLVRYNAERIGAKLPGQVSETESEMLAGGRLSGVGSVRLSQERVQSPVSLLRQTEPARAVIHDQQTHQNLGQVVTHLAPIVVRFIESFPVPELTQTVSPPIFLLLPGGLIRHLENAQSGGVLREHLGQSLINPLG